MPAAEVENAPFDFRAATNGLAQECRRGNLDAQALWGFALVVLDRAAKVW